MGLPSKNDLKFWQGVLFNKDDWDYNFSQLVSWLADGTSDLVVNSLKATNGIDLDGAQLSNLGAATSGSDAVTLDQANTLLNRSSYYYPFSVASGKIDTSTGKANYIQKDSDTQVTILAGNTNPDLTCILSDGTIETVTSNTVLTVQASDGRYHIIKEKESAISITASSSGKVTINKVYPTAPNIGDYYLDNSTVPFKGFKYTSNGWESTEFCYLGFVTVSSGVATVYTPNYNDNWFDFNVSSNGWNIVNTVVASPTSGSSAIPLSTYLPADGSYYECLFEYQIVAQGGNNENSYYRVKDEDSGIIYLFDSADSSSSSDDKREGGQFQVFAKSTTDLRINITGRAFKSTDLRFLAHKKMNKEVL